VEVTFLVLHCHIHKATGPNVLVKLTILKGLHQRLCQLFHFHHFYEMEGNKSNQKTKKTILAGLFLGVHFPKATEPIVDLYEVQGKNSNHCTPFSLCGTTFPFVVLHSPLHNPTSPNILELSNSEVCARGCQFSTQSQSSNKSLHVGLYQAPTEFNEVWYKILDPAIHCATPAGLLPFSNIYCAKIDSVQLPLHQ
jgi:hypothetical protein